MTEAVEWELVEVKDHRLEEWEPLYLEIRAGGSASLVSTEEAYLNHGSHYTKVLRANVAIQAPGCDEPEYRWKLLKPKDAPARPLTLAVLWMQILQGSGTDWAGIEEIADAAIDDFLHGRRDDLLILNGPEAKHLDAFTVEAAAVLMAEYRAMAETFSPDQWVRLTHMLDRAYNLGREVRENEFPSDRATGGGYLSGAQSRAAARAWWPAGAAWAQALWDAYPKGWPEGWRPSANRLALLMCEQWKNRPFAPDGPAAPDPLDLAKRVLPAWKRQKLLNRPQSRTESGPPPGRPTQEQA